MRPAGPALTGINASVPRSDLDLFQERSLPTYDEGQEVVCSPFEISSEPANIESMDYSNTDKNMSQRHPSK